MVEAGCLPTDMDEELLALVGVIGPGMLEASCLPTVMDEQLLALVGMIGPGSR